MLNVNSKETNVLHFSLYLSILKYTEMSINVCTLKSIADWQLLFSSFCTDQRLFNGKTGTLLFFFHYVRFTTNHSYEDFAGELLNNVCLHLFVDAPITFLGGLCGIGWNIEYMKKQGFNRINDVEFLNLKA